MEWALSSSNPSQSIVNISFPQNVSRCLNSSVVRFFTMKLGETESSASGNISSQDYSHTLLTSAN